MDILICGGAGFIGHHTARRLHNEGHNVIVADIKEYEYGLLDCFEYEQLDLSDQQNVRNLFDSYHFDWVFQYGALMGGAGFIFTGENDADIMYESAMMNMNIMKSASENHVKRIFFSSSACAYPAYNQEDPNNPKCSEESAYPAAPDSEYGWEKLFGERMYQTFNRLGKIEARIARFHNIFGQEGTWQGGKEKAPAAMCRKIAMIEDGGEIEIWGDGEQTRSFLYIDECVEGVLRLMNSDYTKPVNIGSEEMVTINQLAHMVAEIAGKKITLKHIPGPLGVRGRNSDNKLIKEVLDWAPSHSLKEGLEKTYAWISEQVKIAKSKEEIKLV